MPLQRQDMGEAPMPGWNRVIAESFPRSRPTAHFLLHLLARGEGVSVGSDLIMVGEIAERVVDVGAIEVPKSACFADSEPEFTAIGVEEIDVAANQVRAKEAT